MRFFAIFYLTRNCQCFCLFKHSLYLEGSSCHHKNVYHVWKVGWQVQGLHNCGHLRQLLQMYILEFGNYLRYCYFGHQYFFTCLLLAYMISSSNYDASIAEVNVLIILKCKSLIVSLFSMKQFSLANNIKLLAFVITAQFVTHCPICH